MLENKDSNMGNNSRETGYTMGYGDDGNMLSYRDAPTHAAFFLPHLQSGMSLLDGGCGPGTITLGLANAIFPGNAVGIDIGEDPVNNARNLAQEQGITNIRFEVGSLNELPFENASFDAVFSHNVLEHLEKPEVALSEIYRVLKPGGVIGVTDVDVDAIIFSPSDDPLVEAFELLYRVWEQNGGNPRIGKLLSSMLYNSGFKKVYGSARVESLGTKEEIQHRGDVEMIGVLTNVYETAVKLGWLNSSEKEKAGRLWSAFAEKQGAFVSITYCQAIGWKE